MRNERGLTLVELLAVLAIFGIIMTLIVTVLINGTKASDRSATNQKLQQEANYIVEMVRKEYLILSDEEISLKIDDVNHTFKMNTNVISEGYKYDFICEDEIESQCESEHTVTIKRTENYSLKLKISKGNLDYTVKTTLSKLQ